MTDQIDLDVIEPEHDQPARPNRRRMLLTGAGLAGVAVLTKAGTASAADDDPVLVGNDHEGESPTTLTNTQGADAFVATSDGEGIALSGVSTDGYGGQFEGGMAPVRLVPAAEPVTPPPGDLTEAAPTGDAHLAGELYVDSDGNLWFNTADGSNWTQLNNQPGQLAFLPTPQRAFDSREEWPVPANTNKGRFAALETREIDLSQFTDIPAGASAAMINVTVDATGPAGWAFVFSGDVEVAAATNIPLASSINWSEPGQIVANTTFTSVSADSKIKVHTSQPTEVVIDVIGYVS